jgi:hypothetical protein
LRKPGEKGRKRSSAAATKVFNPEAGLVGAGIAAGGMFAALAVTTAVFYVGKAAVSDGEGDGGDGLRDRGDDQQDGDA